VSHSREALYRDLKAYARQIREYPNEIRRVAWRIANAGFPTVWPWWRCGFQSLYGRRYNHAGYVGIPRYDVIADEVALYFPEYGTDDGIERLWEFLMSPYDRMPSREELLQQAEEILAARGEEVVNESPF
jgi:hypothetical protein